MPSAATAVSSPTAAPTAKPATSVGQAKTQALAAVKIYFATIDRLQSGQPGVDENDINKVAVQPALSVDVGQINTFHENGWVVKGSTVVVSSRVVAVDLSYKPTSATPVLPTVKAAVCLDVSSAYAIDPQGKRVAVANRPNFYTEIVTLTNSRAGSATPFWRVSDETNTGTPTSCAGH